MFAATSGIIGIIIAALLLIMKIVSINNFGTDYTYPFAPINFEELKTDTITRKNITEHKKRNSILTNNLTRLKYNERE